ncbi:MAG: hypothetical protein QOE96_1849 [Blastocatellia bacterium]|nr:hypothetical protein [Blastocatellia bacterium]
MWKPNQKMGPASGLEKVLTPERLWKCNGPARGLSINNFGLHFDAGQGGIGEIFQGPTRWRYSLETMNDLTMSAF